MPKLLTFSRELGRLAEHVREEVNAVGAFVIVVHELSDGSQRAQIAGCGEIAGRTSDMLRGLARAQSAKELRHANAGAKHETV